MLRLLLQPDRPLRSLDATFLNMFDSSVGATGSVWSTEVVLAEIFRFTYVFTANVIQPYAVTLSDMRLPTNGSGTYMAYESNNTLASGIFPVDLTKPLVINACGELDFQLYTLCPVLANGWTFLGESDKWVSVSNQRFSQLSFDSVSVSVVVSGDVGEVVIGLFLSPSHELVSVPCSIPVDGTVRISVGTTGGSCLSV